MREVNSATTDVQHRACAAAPPLTKGGLGGVLRSFVACKNSSRTLALLLLTLTTLSLGTLLAQTGGDSPVPAVVPDPKQLGGEPDGIVQVGNLIYARNKTSKCFSHHFLTAVQKDSAISTSQRFHPVAVASIELFSFPLVIMTGEGGFELTDEERQNLRQFIEHGGFLLASAGCSSSDWDRSFRREMARVFPEHSLQAIELDHPVFHTIYDVTELKAKRGKPRPLEGLMLGGRLGVLYSQDGLNDTPHSAGCCCCGGNEISNAKEINANILAYSLIY